MEKVIYFAVILFLSLGVIACASDTENQNDTEHAVHIDSKTQNESDNPSQNEPGNAVQKDFQEIPLIGKWLVVKGEGVSGPSNEGAIYTFTDSELSLSKDGNLSETKYYTSQDTMFITFPNIPDPFVFVYSFVDGQMIMKTASGSQTLYLEREE